MIIYLLAMTSIITLIINLILTRYLLKDKLTNYSFDTDKKEVTNFVLTPNVQNDIASDTEVLATEIISKGDS